MRVGILCEAELEGSVERRRRKLETAEEKEEGRYDDDDDERVGVAVGDGLVDGIERREGSEWLEC